MSRNSHKHNKRNLDQPSKTSPSATNGVHPPQTPGGYGAYVVKSTSTNGHGPVVSDASEGTAAKRRPQKQKTVLTSRRNSEYYVKEIIKRLEKIYSLTGARPSLIFDDWLSIAEATLTALPDQVKAVGVTGWFAEDPPEVKAIFEMVRARYQNSYHPEGATVVWECFGEAFSLLLESSDELSLWGIGSDECRVPKIMRRRRSKTAVLDKVTETKAESGTKIVRPAHFSARGNETDRSGHKRIGPEIVRLAS